MAKSGRNRKRDWTELPDELTSAILSRLGTVEILESAEKVCKKWRKISKDPLFWRKIDLRIDDGDIDFDYDYERFDALFRHAVDRSSGHVVDVNIEQFGTDELLEFISKSARKIKRLRLLSCNEISDEGLSKMASKLRKLEELDISLCRRISHEAVKKVGRSCPLLKSFKFNKEWCRFSDDESDSDEQEPEEEDDDFDEYQPHYGGHYQPHYGGHYQPPFGGHYQPPYGGHYQPPYGGHYQPPFGGYGGLYFDDFDDYPEFPPFAHPPVDNAPVARAPVRKDENADAIAIAGTMQGLRHLQLCGNKLTDDGLKKILDCCPHLESLDLRLCFNLDMGIDLETRCAERIKKLWLPRASIKGKGFTSRSDGYCFKWVELPDNVTMSILSRLGTVDILDNAQKVCMKWRKICKEMNWTSIHMRNDFAPDITFDYDKMCHHVVDRSCGNLVNVNMEDLISDDLLEYIADRSSGIKRLRLACSYNLSDEGLIEVASKFPLLEELDISVCENLSHKPVRVFGRSCPLLKSFKLNKKWHKYSDNFFEEIVDDDGPWSKDDDALCIAETMHGLHHLQLFGNQLTNVGLRAILDSCPHLESLDLRYCFNLNLLGDLGRRCREQIRKLLLPTDSIADYGLMPSRNWQPPRPISPPSPKHWAFWEWDTD